MSSEQAKRLIFTDRHHRGASGRRVVAIRRGVGADAAWWRGMKPWDRYRLRVEAAAHALRDPVFALESAAVVHRLPTFGEPVDLHVLAAEGSRGYRRGGIVRHMRRPGVAIVRVEGVLATSLEDTVLDLIRVLPLVFAVAVLEAALWRGVTVDGLRGMLDAHSDRRGRRRAQAALDHADGRSESVLESMSRVVIELLGYPAPELQVEFATASGQARADFFWRAEGVVGEADGKSKYFGEAAGTDEVVHAERRREIALRRVVRDIARWEWADVVDPARLDAILAAVGLERVRPMDPHLAEAVTNPRSDAQSSRRLRVEHS
ncbi:hypothetical protein ACH3VR_05540 [Microbacterium sp. B2969]|uniref:DUF559 domain-containing protein n=1 Tax=Microbacterium alkaliflavum TaxID=3248839 RepID=A0ABW7Q6G5_9MICO